MKPLRTLLALVLLSSASAHAFEQAPTLPLIDKDNYYDFYSVGKAPHNIVVSNAVVINGARLHHVQVTLAASDIIGMYAAPVQIVAAAGDSKSIVVTRAVFTITRTSTAFTGGGAVIFQYGNTVNGGGIQALDSTLASTVITGSAATTISVRNGAVISDSTSTNHTGVGLYISNATAAFAAGTGTAVVDVFFYYV